MKRVQPKLFGGAVVTYPTGPRKHQQTLPGLDRVAAALDAEAVRIWMEARRAAELPELDEPYEPEE